MPFPWRDNEVPDDVKKALKAVIKKLCQRESDAKYKPKRKGKKKSKKAPRAEEPAVEVPVAAQVDYEHCYRQLREDFDQVMAFARALAFGAQPSSPDARANQASPCYHARGWGLPNAPKPTSVRGGGGGQAGGWS